MLKHFIRINWRISDYFMNKFPNFCIGPRKAQVDFKRLLEKLIEKRGSGPFTILEIGGIDRPCLKKDPRYRYVGLDVEVNDNCYQMYDEFYVQSVEEPILVKADLIISKAVLEHVPNVSISFQRMYDSLNEGGEMLHLVPGGHHPYSLATKFVGHKWQRKLIHLLLPPKAAQVLGYKAYYNLCSYSQMKRLVSSLSPENANIIPYWAAVGYFRFFFPLFLIIASLNRICEVFCLRQLASYMVIYLKKRYS